jgi:hypothetical protein
MLGPAPPSAGPSRAMALDSVCATARRTGGRPRRSSAWLPPPRRPAPPQRLSCPLPPSGTRPGFVRPGRLAVAQRAAVRRPGPPRSPRGPLWPPRPPPVQRGVYACAPARHPRLSRLRQPFGRAAQRRPATWPEPRPGRRDESPLAHEDARPVRQKWRPCSLGAVGGSLAVGDARRRPPPQPGPGPTGAPCGLSARRDAGDASHRATGRVVGEERGGDTSAPRLERPLTPRSPKAGGTQGLPRTAARAYEARSRTHAAWQPRPLAPALGGRHGRCAARAACQALLWGQPPGRHGGTPAGQLKHRMGARRGQCPTLPMATGTSLGQERDGGGRCQPDLGRAGRPRGASRLPSRGGWPPSLALGRRRLW